MDLGISKEKTKRIHVTGRVQLSCQNILQERRKKTFKRVFVDQGLESAFPLSLIRENMFFFNENTSNKNLKINFMKNFFLKS